MNRAFVLSVLVVMLLMVAPWPGAAAETAAQPGSTLGLGFDAPLLQVDRFSDEAATLLKRSKVKGLPGPNEPIDLDRPPFLVEIEGPGGRKDRCYDLDLRSESPGLLYVFYDDVGNYILTQFPVVDSVPGQAGYSDLWDVWRVTVPRSFKPDNSIRDAETVRRLLQDAASGYTAERTGALVNGPIVPEGSSARMKAERRGGAAALKYFWYRGRRAPYLYFEEKLRLVDGTVPVSRMTLGGVTRNASADAGGIPAGLHGAGSIRVAALPGDPGYSPLHRLVGSDGEPIGGLPLNCPVVGP